MAGQIAAAIGGGVFSGIGNGLSQMAYWDQVNKMQDKNNNFLMSYLQQQQTFASNYLIQKAQLQGLVVPSTIMQKNASYSPQSSTGHFTGAVLEGSKRNETTQYTGGDINDGSAQTDGGMGAGKVLTPRPYLDSTTQGTKVRDVSSTDHPATLQTASQVRGNPQYHPTPTTQPDQSSIHEDGGNNSAVEETKSNVSDKQFALLHSDARSLSSLPSAGNASLSGLVIGSAEAKNNNIGVYRKDSMGSNDTSYNTATTSER